MRYDLADLAEGAPELARRLRSPRERVAEVDGAGCRGLDAARAGLRGAGRVGPRPARLVADPAAAGAGGTAAVGREGRGVVNMRHVRGDAVLVRGTGAPTTARPASLRGTDVGAAAAGRPPRHTGRGRRVGRGRGTRAARPRGHHRGRRGKEWIGG